jgi:hypothetical protein
MPAKYAKLAKVEELEALVCPPKQRKPQGCHASDS